MGAHDNLRVYGYIAHIRHPKFLRFTGLKNFLFLARQKSARRRRDSCLVSDCGAGQFYAS